MDRFAVTVKDRHPDTGRVNLDTVIAKDFLGFPDHFHFFQGVAIVLKVTNMRNHIECNLRGER